MASEFALTANGLSTQTQEEILEEMSQKLRSIFGNNLTTDPTSIMGQILNVVSEFRADDQQVTLAVYRSFDPNAAIGTSLDARGTLTGSLRDGALASTVEGILTFSGVGTMLNGDLIQNDDNDTTWELTDGPHTSVGPFPEEIDAAFQATTTGAILAQANTNWSAVTVVANLDGFTNPTDDAEVGRDRQPDGPFRVDRNIEVFGAGLGPLLTVKAVVSKVDGVLSVNVYHNPSTSPTDSDGIPFKALNVVVQTTPPTPTAALQQLIFNAIFSAEGGGGEAFAIVDGTEFTGLAVDAEGQSQPSAFNTVAVQNIVIEIDLDTSTSEEAVSENITDVVAAAVLAEAQENWEVVGRDVLSMNVSGVVDALKVTGQITGVDGVVVRLAIDPAAPTVVTKLAIGIRQISDFDSPNITVITV